MDDATVKKFYGMYDMEEYLPETDYKPNINTTPQIEVDNRNYTRNTNTANGFTPTTNNTPNNSIPNNLPNNFPNSSTNSSGGKFFINGKPIGDYIRDTIYYNPSNPLDIGNYIDLIAIAAESSQKYGKGALEKILISAGIAAAGIKIKEFLYETFVNNSP